MAGSEGKVTKLVQFGVRRYSLFAMSDSPGQAITNTCVLAFYRRAQPWRCDRHKSETKTWGPEIEVMLTSDSVADMTADSPYPTPGVSAESVSNCCGSETSSPTVEISLLAEQTPGSV